VIDKFKEVFRYGMIPRRMPGWLARKNPIDTVRIARRCAIDKDASLSWGLLQSMSSDGAPTQYIRSTF
jgi:hypothetical protein